jgi:hypothetical protein
MTAITPSTMATFTSPVNTADLYINLLQKAILDDLYGQQRTTDGRTPRPEELERGLYWPDRAHSMIGRKRMMNVRECLEHCLKFNIPGDVIETGVWRGGTTMFMRGILKVYGSQRKVYVADSFEGLPPPDARYPVDAGDRHYTKTELAVSLPEVRDNFERYGLLDDQVVFIKGFFEHSLPKVKFDKLAILRLDGDMYSSTIQVFDMLYDKVSRGGFIIVDDYALKGARAATHDFRDKRGITTPIIDIDGIGAYWQKE